MVSACTVQLQNRNFLFQNNPKGLDASSQTVLEEVIPFYNQITVSNFRDIHYSAISN